MAGSAEGAGPAGGISEAELEKGTQLLEKYRKDVSASPQAALSGSAYDASTWQGPQKGGAPHNAALDRWHKVVEEAIAGQAKVEDLLALLSPIIHDDIIFHPPTYWKKRKGKMLACWILQQVFEIFGTS